MTDAFTQAIADVYADENVTVAATYTPAATGVAAAVRVVRLRADEVGGRLHGNMVRLSAPAQETALRVTVPKAAVAAPARGDTVAIEGQVYPVIRFDLDGSGLVWRLGLGQPA